MRCTTITMSRQLLKCSVRSLTPTLVPSSHSFSSKSNGTFARFYSCCATFGIDHSFCGICSGMAFKRHVVSKVQRHSRITVPSGFLKLSTSSFHTLSSKQNILFSQYKVPSAITPSKSVTTDLIGNKRFDDRRDNPLHQKLVSARTTDEILAVLESDGDMLDAVSLYVAIDALFDALKTGPQLAIRAKHQILTSVGVQKLCKLLRRYGPHMDPGDLINGVKLLSFLCVPGSHHSFQILLKLISKHANALDLQQLAYLQFLLDKLHPDSKSPLSKALEFALPVVFESKLTTQLERSDPHSVADYLHYATKYQLSAKSINFLAESAARIVERFDSRSLLSILWSLCDTQVSDPSHEPLVTHCFAKITDCIDDFKLMEVGTILSKSVKKFSTKEPFYYNEDFLNAYCHKIIKMDVDPEITLWSIKNVSLLRHLNIEHVDRIGEIIASNPAHILNNDHLFSIIVKSFANLNYKPETWSKFSSLLLEHPALTKNFSKYEITLAVDFLALDLFPENIIRTLFSADGLPILEEYFGRFQNPIALLLLYNAVKVLYPEYRGPLPPISMVEQWKEASRASRANWVYNLKGALQTGLGGESYVINGLYHDGIHIDHGIVMRKGGYPVAVNSQSDSQTDSVSSIAKPAESIIILVKCCSRDSYANNTRRLRGTVALELRILESLGHPVLAVDVENWLALPDHEKIPFLMHRIREKTEHMQWNQNWGDVIPP